jgi:hypothetical protein
MGPEERALRALLEKQKRLKQQRTEYALGLRNESELEKPDPASAPVPGVEFTEGMGPTARETLLAGQVQDQGPQAPWTAAELPPAIPERSEALTHAVGPEAGVALPQHIRDLLKPSEELVSKEPTDTGMPAQFQPDDVMEQPAARDKAFVALERGTPKEAPIPGQEPFQVSAEAEQRIADLEQKKGLVEAMRLIGTGAAQIGGRSRSIEAPDTSGEVNRELDKAQDVLPEAERAWLNQKFSLQLPRGITRTALNTMLPTIGRLTGGQAALDQKRDMDLLRLQETNRRFGVRTEMTKGQKAVEVGLKFDTSPFIKAQKEAMLMADKALAQLAEGSSLSEMGALISLARAAGEKGPLSDTDVGRWAQRRGLLPKMELWSYQLATGHFTPQHKAEMKQILDEMREVSQQGVRTEADRWAKRYSTNPGLYGSYDDIMKVLQPEQPSATGEAPAATTTSERVKVKDKNGQVVTVPAHQLDQALKQGYTRA